MNISVVLRLCPSLTFCPHCVFDFDTCLKLETFVLQTQETAHSVSAQIKYYCDTALLFLRSAPDSSRDGCLLPCGASVAVEPAEGHLRPDHRVPERPGLAVPLGPGGALPPPAVRGEEAEEGGGGRAAAAGGVGRGRGEKEGASGSTPYVSFQGEWGVTAQQEAEESRRIQEFQETVPKMRSQLRVLTHLYQVAGSTPGL